MAFSGPARANAYGSQMHLALIQDFYQWFAKKALAGLYGSYDNTLYAFCT